MLVESFSTFSCPLGVGAVAATSQGVSQVWLPGDAAIKQLLVQQANHSCVSREAARQLECYFNKQLQRFELPVDISGLPAFRQKILLLALQIPYGAVVTYGQLSVLAGVDRAARAIGGAMAANPIPVIIPCHRVVSAAGKLTGYSGAGGLSMKKYLLNLEAADFRGKFFLT